MARLMGDSVKGGCWLGWLRLYSGWKVGSASWPSWVGQRFSPEHLSLLPVVTHQTPASSGPGPMVLPLPGPVGSTTETSGGPELSDSLSSGGIMAQAPLRKVKVSVIIAALCLGLGLFVGTLGS